jgi:CelD/BcsL family acetyltransferase involved in cellulose biosynthesis
MTSTDHGLADALASRVAAAAVPAQSRVNIAIHRGLLAAEPAWRALEREAIFTPYQRFDWIHEIARSQRLADEDFIARQLCCPCISIAGLASPLPRFPAHLLATATGCPFGATLPLV